MTHRIAERFAGHGEQLTAENQPMTLVTNAVRSLTLDGTGGPTALGAILWSVGLLIVFFPIGLYLYLRRTSN